MNLGRVQHGHATNIELNLLIKEFELFHTPAREGYVTMPVNGHYETWPLNSTEFNKLLARQYSELTGAMLSKTRLQNDIRMLEGAAILNGPAHDVHLRVAEYDGRIYVDLANDQWEVVEITSHGYEVVTNPPVKFRRAPSMNSLPSPERGGSIDEWRPFVNIGSGTDWKLLVAFVVNAFCPRGSYPILVLQGDYCTGKSTLTKMIRALTDPNEAPARPFPRNEEDLFVSAHHGWVLAFDNLSKLARRESDALCRLANGTGFATRKRYTNATESLLAPARSVIVNSIAEVVTQADLLDRAIVLHLPTLDRTQRRDEQRLWQDFDAVRPRILGALFDAVSMALRDYDRVRIPTLPRMADFVRWACASAPACGWCPQAFLRAYEPEQVTSDRLLDASPVVQSVLDLRSNQNGSLYW